LSNSYIALNLTANTGSYSSRLDSHLYS